MCPYYAGRVYFVVANLRLWKDFDDDDDDDDVWGHKQRMVVANSFGWLAQQPSSRPHWNVDHDFLLCTLTE
jgi:hypothetical protein